MFDAVELEEAIVGVVIGGALIAWGIAGIHGRKLAFLGNNKLNFEMRMTWIRVMLVILAAVTAGLACILRSGPLLIVALAIWFVFLIWRGIGAKSAIVRSSNVGSERQSEQASRETKALLWFVGLMALAMLVALVLTAVWYIGALGILFAIAGGIVLLTIGAIVAGFVVFARRVRGIYQSQSPRNVED